MTQQSYEPSDFNHFTDLNDLTKSRVALTRLERHSSEGGHVVSANDHVTAGQPTSPVSYVGNRVDRFIKATPPPRRVEWTLSLNIIAPQLVGSSVEDSSNRIGGLHSSTPPLHPLLATNCINLNNW